MKVGGVWRHTLRNTLKLQFENFCVIISFVSFFSICAHHTHNTHQNDHFISEKFRFHTQWFHVFQSILKHRNLPKNSRKEEFRCVLGLDLDDWFWTYLRRSGAQQEVFFEGAWKIGKYCISFICNFMKQYKYGNLIGLQIVSV